MAEEQVAFPEPEWVEYEAVVELHDRLVASDGLPGFPHPGYLESALAAPKQQFYYGDPADLFDLAAAYLYHIAKAHAFSDANKRTAYTTAIVFLAANGPYVLPPANVLALAEATVAVAEGTMGKVALAAMLRQLAE